MKQQTLQENAKAFKALHHNGKILVLPNVWDSLSALLLEDLEYPAVATASAAIALSNGFEDGEKISFNEHLSVVKNIVSNIKVPVTMDMEKGYAGNLSVLTKNIKRLIDAGVSGINIEDSLQDIQGMATLIAQCKKIESIRHTAEKMGVPLFINARTDVYLQATALSNEEKLEEIITRGKAYKNAGADGFYPMFAKEAMAIECIVREVGLPVNILLLPGIPGFEKLRAIGVARVSLGPGLLKMSIKAMKEIAEKLLYHQGMEEIQENPVTTTYLTGLVTKHKK